MPWLEQYGGLFACANLLLLSLFLVQYLTLIFVFFFYGNNCSFTKCLVWDHPPWGTGYYECVSHTCVRFVSSPMRLLALTMSSIFVPQTRPSLTLTSALTASFQRVRKRTHFRVLTIWWFSVYMTWIIQAAETYEQNSAHKMDLGSLHYCDKKLSPLGMFKLLMEVSQIGNTYLWGFWMIHWFVFLTVTSASFKAMICMLCFNRTQLLKMVHRILAVDIIMHGSLNPVNAHAKESIQWSLLRKPDVLFNFQKASHFLFLCHGFKMKKNTIFRCVLWYPKKLATLMSCDRIKETTSKTWVTSLSF